MKTSSAYNPLKAGFSALALGAVLSLGACSKSEAPTSASSETASTTAAAPTGGRDFIRIVGSSTVFPFSTTVAEYFGRSTSYKTPFVESTGSGGGLKLFCGGIGESHPDITNASRRIKTSEVELCAQNGVNDIVEVKIGFDGIVLANSRKSSRAEFTLQDIFLGLAKDVPDGNGGFKPNPYTTWSEINSALPSVKIEVLGPPPTSGTRDAFVELAMEGGCARFEAITALKASDSDAYKARCHTIREDSAFIEAGENDNLIVQKLNASPTAFGIFGYSFLDQNSDSVQGSLIDGVPPTFENIADASYPVARSLYFYAKKDHVGVIPGVTEFLSEFTSERASGPDGYLSEKGMIPLQDDERAAVRASTLALAPLSLD